MKRHFLVIILILSWTVLPGYTTCGPKEPILKNPGFDLWCGDKLCGWEVNAGDVRRVTTWHRKDYGVSLVGAEVVISQLADTGADCFEFDLLLDRDEGVEVDIEMDFLDDGVAEYSHPISTDKFRPSRYLITAPTWYDSVRFVIRKRGAGRAVLAQVWVDESDECTGPPVELLDLPDGAPCETDHQCRNGQCASIPGEYSRCALCAGPEDCPGEDICSLTWVDERPSAECAPAGSSRLAHWCYFDEECSTGICCEGMCSLCCEDEACPQGRCKSREEQIVDGSTVYWVWALPYQCAPGEGFGAPGDACLQDDDCESGSCLGTGPLELCANCLGETCFVSSGEHCGTGQACQGDAECIDVGEAGGVCQ